MLDNGDKFNKKIVEIFRHKNGWETLLQKEKLITKKNPNSTIEKIKKIVRP